MRLTGLIGTTLHATSGLLALPTLSLGSSASPTPSLGSSASPTPSSGLLEIHISPSAYSLQLTVFSLLFLAYYCLQLTIFSLLPSAYYLQLIVFSLLSSAYCLQLTVFSLFYCLQLTVFNLLCPRCSRQVLGGAVDFTTRLSLMNEVDNLVMSIAFLFRHGLITKLLLSRSISLLDTLAPIARNTCDFCDFASKL